MPLPELEVYASCNGGVALAAAPTKSKGGSKGYSLVSGSGGYSLVSSADAASSGPADPIAPLAHVTELAYQGAPEGSGVLFLAENKGYSLVSSPTVAPAENKGVALVSNTAPADEAAEHEQAEPLRLAVLLRPKVPMRQLVAVGPVAAMAVLAALEEAGANPDAIGIAWPHDVVLIGSDTNLRGSFVTLATLSTKAGYADGMFVALGIDINANALVSALSANPAGQATSHAAPNPAHLSTEVQVRFARTLQAHLVSAMRQWEKNAATPNAQAGPWAPFLQDYFDRVPLLGQAVNVCYPNGRVYARGIFVGIDIWGRATVRTRRAGDIEFPAEKFRIEPQSY